MTMHTERLTAAVLDMWYGKRSVWYDSELPYEMNIQLSNPAYVDHQEREYYEAFPRR